MSSQVNERTEFRNIDYAGSEAARMVEMINAPEDQVTREDRERLTTETGFQVLCKPCHQIKTNKEKHP